MLSATFCTGSNPLPHNRVNDEAHIYYSVQVYENNEGTPREGWDLLKIYSDPNSYFGAAYRHERQKCIIAHRGTQDSANWRTNIAFITQQLSQQQVNPWELFAKKIIGTFGNEYSYSFTGHSLGGWLAQVCLWRYQDEYIQGQAIQNNVVDAVYKDAFAITLDDPAAKPLLGVLQPPDILYQVNLNNLDTTAHLSYPSLVNTALEHIGTVYAVSPDIRLTTFKKHTVLYTVKTQDKNKLLATFSPESGLPKHCRRVIDWAKVVRSNIIPRAHYSKSMLNYLGYMLHAYVKGDIDPSKYLGFFNYVSGDDSMTIADLPPIKKFELRHKIHYSVKAFEAYILPLRNMPLAMREFLKELNDYRVRETIIRQTLSIVEQLELPLNAYKINLRDEIELDKKITTLTVCEFREQLLAFLNKYPFLVQTKLAILREEYFNKRLQLIETTSMTGFLSELREQSIQTLNLIEDLYFRQGTVHLYKFIKSTEKELERTRKEHFSLEKQLVILNDSKLCLGLLVFSKENQQEIKGALETQERRLKCLRQGVLALISYFEDNMTDSKTKLNEFIQMLQSPICYIPDINKLLDMAYSLDAKIMARQNKLNLAKGCYEEAIQLSRDVLIASNYAGLLIDIGRTDRSSNYYRDAHEQYIAKVYLFIDQLKIDEQFIICSDMAYGFILLAQSIANGDIGFDINIEILHQYARNLLERSIRLNGRYVNSRLFSAILAYYENNYEDALQKVNMALDIQPMHPIALMCKGFILEKIGNKDKEAMALLHEAKMLLTIDPNNRANNHFIEEINDILTIIQNKQSASISTFLTRGDCVLI